jgi:hypothetical protein
MLVTRSQEELNRMLNEMSVQNIYAVMLEYLDEGRIQNPEIVNLPSFDAKYLRENNFEFAGDLNEFGMYSFVRYFSAAKKSICTEFKIYFFKEKFCTNGLGVYGSVRLVTLLRKITERERKGFGEKYSFEIYLCDDMTDGALIFNNGIVVRFSSNQDGVARNYFIKTVESNFSAVEEIDMAAIGVSSVKAVFTKYTLDGLRRRAQNDNRAIKNLLGFAEKFPSKII